MAVEVDIYNRALQKLGAQRVASTTEDSVNARACLACYETLRDAELRSHYWRFAIKRASLAEDATDPDWGKANSYTLPADYLQIAPPYPEDNVNDRDWEVEGGKIYSDETSPLYLRYVAKISDVSLMDVLFREALSTLMALEMCEELTQSNSKKQTLQVDYDQIIHRARRANAFESIPGEMPEDTWVSVRL